MRLHSPRVPVHAVTSWPAPANPRVSSARAAAWPLRRAVAVQKFTMILALGVTPCGLGARDTLRTEMGYPLHGQDLSLDITPVQARNLMPRDATELRADNLVQYESADRKRARRY